ncbi:MAG: spore maturation protein [Lachnospiraceae bacterium]|nr:spore maturation protein [Lachnospiraceae bacterium]
MGILLYLSDLIVPLVVLIIVGYGMAEKTAVYDSFIRGAGNGLKTVAKLAPTFIGLMTATGVLRASGFLELAAAVMGRILPDAWFPSALVPLGVVRLFSSSAASGLLLEIYKLYGTDSLTGRIASLMMCCTETVFYTMSVYFTSAGIKKARYTLCGALLATFAGIAACAILARQMM